MFNFSKMPKSSFFAIPSKHWYYSHLFALLTSLTLLLEVGVLAFDRVLVGVEDLSFLG